MRLICFTFLCISLVSCNPIKSIVGGKTKLDQDFFEERSSTTLKNGLISFWKLDESTFSAPRNDSFGSNTLSVATTVPTVGGRFGNAVDCSSSTNDGDLNNTSPINMSFGFTGDFTLSFWIYFNSVTGGDRIFDIDNLLTVSVVGTEARLYFDGVNVGVSVSSGTWYHVLFVVDRDVEIRSYLDGVYTGQVTNDSTATSYNANEIKFCTLLNGTTPLNGNLDSVGFWNRALTDDEINELSSGSTLD